MVEDPPPHWGDEPSPLSDRLDLAVEVAVSPTPVTRKLETVSGRLDHLLELHRQGLVDDDEFVETKNHLRMEAAGLRDRRDELQRHGAGTALELTTATFSWLNQAEETFLRATQAQRRRIFELVALEPEILDGNLLCRAQKPFAIAAGGGSTSGLCPHQESNLDRRLRKPLFYPLNYEGVKRKNYTAKNKKRQYDVF